MNKTKEICKKLFDAVMESYAFDAAINVSPENKALPQSINDTIKNGTGYIQVTKEGVKCIPHKEVNNEVKN